MICSGCEFENRDDAAFCGECGQSLAVDAACSSCGRSNPGGRKFCDGCGAALEAGVPAAPERAPLSYTPKHLADRILQSKSAIEGERKQVTVLFADVKGSIELAGIVGAEEWHRILDRFFQIRR